MLDRFTQLLWGWHVLLLPFGGGGLFQASPRGFTRCAAWGAGWGAALASRRKGEEGGKLSSFQALTAALAGSLGTGNIVGVGGGHRHQGAGALFWMWASALLGMMTVYAENVLAARHRQAPGALGYIRAAGRWGGKPLAAVYAGGAASPSLGMGTMAQTHAAAAPSPLGGAGGGQRPGAGAAGLLGGPGRAGPGGEDHPALGAPDDPCCFLAPPCGCCGCSGKTSPGPLPAFSRGLSP